MAYQTLKNGVKVFNLTVQNDFMEAQHMFDHADRLMDVDAESAYQERHYSTRFAKTFGVKIERTMDYGKFEQVLEAQKAECKFDRLHHARRVKGKIRDYYGTLGRAGVNHISDDERYSDEVEWLSNEMSKADKWAENCDCGQCAFRTPTFEEWKTGKYQVDEKRTMKLGKALRKAGFNQDVLDFYSEQVKTDGEMYLTISDRVQHIAGMSFYAEKGSWNGYNGTSCQDPRHDGYECRHLAGSLHDDKLWVGMLHSSLDDLEDMNGKLLARVIFRQFKLDGKPYLFASDMQYGNNNTKSALRNAMEMLDEVDIFGRNYVGSDKAFAYINGYEVSGGNDTETIEVDDWVWMSCECPMCEGHGELEVRHTDIECPMCGGTGTYEQEVHVVDDHEVEVEESEYVFTYDEGYDYSTDEEDGDGNVWTWVDETAIQRARIRASMSEEEMEELREMGTL
jgi:hypothetical protein